jgi:hypothetical protein
MNTTRFQNFKVQFYDSGSLQSAIISRTSEERPVSISMVAKRDLERYYEVLRKSLPKFSVGEASLLVDALNGCQFEPYSISMLWANVSDAVKEGYGKKWEVDGSAFVERLRAFSYAECMATVDAVERFWSGPYRQEGPLEPRLRDMGLVAN